MKASKTKITMADAMPGEEILAEGRAIFAELFDYVKANGLVLAVSPESYTLQLAPGGLCYGDKYRDDPGKVPLDDDDIEEWYDADLGVSWSEFDPNSYD